MTKRFFLFLLLMAASASRLAGLLHGPASSTSRRRRPGRRIDDPVHADHARLVPGRRALPRTRHGRARVDAGRRHPALLALLARRRPPATRPRCRAGPNLRLRRDRRRHGDRRSPPPLAVATRSAQAQFVNTLTAVSDRPARAVHRRRRQPGHAANGEGQPLTDRSRAPTTSTCTPSALIFVETPARDSTVTSPVTSREPRRIFEATLRNRGLAGRQAPCSTERSPRRRDRRTRGTWSMTLALPPGPVTLVLYEASAEDGSHLHTTEVPLHVIALARRSATMPCPSDPR